MGQCNLDILAFEMDDRVERTNGHIFRQQVQQAVLGNEFFAVINQRQTRIEIGVVTQQFFDIVIAEMVVLKESFAVVRHELDNRTAFLGTVIVLDICVRSQLALCELCPAHLAFAVGLHGKETR